ncbi:hypothetical protein N7465_000452 [Penicillium sp. CMV-2018d]|nr:hypothetical protein N7465_000452 [Penicillium sp. CMV-2018d]
MDAATDSVAHVTDLSDPFDLNATEWSEATMICGGLGIILDLYDQNMELEVALRYSEQTIMYTFPVRIAVNRSARVNEYLRDVAESIRKNMPVGTDQSCFLPASIRPQGGLNLDSFEATVAFRERQTQSIPFPIRFGCVLENPKLALSATFEKDHHDQRYVRRLLSQLCQITRQLGLSSSLLRNLDLVCNADAQDLRRWNELPALSDPACVHWVIAKHILKSPDAIAIDSWDGRLTYRELDQLSSNLATHLSAVKIPEGSIIPLLFEKSRWTVVAMMTVLRAGHAFLLLDIAHPDGRLEILTQHVNAPMIICSAMQKGRAMLLWSQVIVASTATSKDVIKEIRGPLKPTEPHDLALVVFTSGTTGRPKATAIEHHSVCSSLITLAEHTGVSKTSRFYQFSSYAWDAAFAEILMTLFSGGCICIPSEEDRLNRLVHSISSVRANHILLTPTVLGLLSPHEVPTLRHVVVGGEKATRALVQTWADSVNLTSAYGPAEATVACMVNQEFGEQFDPAMLGSVLGCRVWVTIAGNMNQLAPVGVIGELLIEGSNVARGYLNDPEKTAQSFPGVPPRWLAAMKLDQMIPSSRFYRTGDLARYTSHGKLVFVGRKDFQVKVRGQRVELEEVQAQIQKRVRLLGAQVFVDVLDTSITAYIHLPNNSDHKHEQIASESSRLRLALREVLPEFMVPTFWIPLKVVPLSSTSKLDRRALAELGDKYLSDLRINSYKTEELTQAEWQLSQLWGQLSVSAQSPSPTDHFFVLGGDSVKAMQLVSLARQANMRLSVKDIFGNPTLSAMSSIAEKIAPNSGPERTLAFSMVSKDDLSGSLTHLTGLGHECDKVIDMFPCTELQEGMFSASLSVPGSYSSQYVFTVQSRTMMERLRRAWERTLIAIPILRARFIPSTTGFNQVIMSSKPLSCATTPQSLDSYLDLDRQRPFAIGEPLARYCIVDNPSSSDVHLVWSLHHSTFDGWTINEILDHVHSQLQGDQIETPTVSLNGDFSKFVHFTRLMDDDNDARTFWRKQLLGAPIPSYPTVPAGKAQIADRSAVMHSMDASQLVRSGITITILARATLALLLSHYENSDDIILGNTVHGRSSLPLELHNVLGPTLATLPIRVKVNRQLPISQFLANLQEQFIATIPFEQYGLQRIRHMDNDTRSSSSFRVLLIVQNTDSITSIGDGVQGREAFRCLHEYPLVITITPAGTQTKILLTFDDTLLSKDQVQALAFQFEQTSTQLCSLSGSTRICDLDLASRADNNHFLRWNSEHHMPVETSILALLHRQFERDPEAVAIDSWDGTATYEALDKISSLFAAELVRLGVGPNTLVGHCFEKSMWAPVALLAIVKAGGAFAPFSPSYPRKRLLSFTHDVGIQLIVCSSMQRASLSDGPWKTLIVDQEGSKGLRPNLAVLPTSVNPDSLLYALHTSGTTGEPKTFTVQHAAFATGVVTREPSIPRGSGQRVLQFGPYTFRLGIENILATLASGGCICIPSDSAIMNNLSGYMKDARVSFANVTPSVARTLNPDRVPDLKVLLLSGEPPDRGLITTWTGRVQLINGYGPSEFTAKQTLNFCMSPDDPQNLGRAVGANLWVVDPENHERLSPLGAIGELLIEGPTLANGYMHRPSETEKRFIPAPSWHPGLHNDVTTTMTLFKTGDLVRYNLDGSLTSIGRADGQVKLNGQRFEAKEVQHLLKQCISSESLDIMVDVLKLQGQELDVVVAFLASAAHKLQSAITIDLALSKQIGSQKRKIARFLSPFLPGYMIPSIFIGVSIIPITANGKVDRRTLRTFASHLSLSSLTFNDDDIVIKPPTSVEEKTLHGLWQRVLGLEEHQFGVDDHFFELGGSSMTAIRLVGLAHEAQVSLDSQSVLRHPVLQDMALQIQRAATHMAMTPTTLPRFGLLQAMDYSLEELNEQLSQFGIPEDAVEDAYPSLALQSYYMKKAVTFPGSTSWEHVFELPDNIDLERLESALECTWKATPSLRTRLVSVSGKFVQVVCKEGFVCRRLTGLESCFEHDRNSSWGLGVPLSRFSIVTNSQDGALRAYLVWSANHVIWDGWSRNLIFDDIDYAYKNGSLPSGRRPSYNSFLAHVWGRRKPTTTQHDSSLIDAEYIGRQFTSLPRVNWTKHVAQNSMRATMRVDLPVLTESRVSHSSLLLSAWTLAVAFVEKSNDVLIANEIGGRVNSFPGVENLAAFLVTAVPLCVGIDPGTIREHASRVQRHAIETMSIQHDINLDERLVSQMETSAYWVLIHDQGGYEEPATESLGLRRCRAEKIGLGMWPFHLTFIVHLGNTHLEMQALFNTDMVGVEKLLQLFGCLRSLLLDFIFAPGGLDQTTVEMHSALTELVQDKGKFLEAVRNITSIEPWVQGPGYNPYST